MHVLENELLGEDTEDTVRCMHVHNDCKKLTSAQVYVYTV